MLLDVVMCTWNSNKPFFRHVLQSIKQEIPVHCFILIDRFSSDNTLQVVRSFFPEAKLVLTDSSLAKSRQLGIQNVDTEYFVFVDDDVILPKGWFEKLWSSLDSKTGAIHAYAVPALRLSYEEKWREWQEKWAKSKLRKRRLKDASLEKESKIIEVTEENKNKFSGYTHNTIIKLDACKDWNPSSDFPVFEDQVLLWHIVKKGYKWKITREITVQHYAYRNLSGHLRKFKWRIAGQRLVGLSHLSLKQLLVTDFIKRFVIGCKACIGTRDPVVLAYALLLHFASLDGYLRWNKYVYLTR
jgi:glycosyltransferase involved in cell wall biosynthesis